MSICYFRQIDRGKRDRKIRRSLPVFRNYEYIGPNAVLQASDGNLWGTTSASTVVGVGKVYTIATDGTFLQSIPMTQTTTGIQPAAPLIQGRDGKLYGTAPNYGVLPGGGFASGTIFIVDAGLGPSLTSIAVTAPNSSIAKGTAQQLTARADLIVSVHSVIATAGSSANGIDVVLSNSGPSAVTIGGFSFGISIANLNISFTDANTSTAIPYIFGADSLFGPDLTGPTSGQSLSTSDLFGIPFSGVTLGAGTTVGLGHVLFDVSSNAPSGSFPVDLALFPTTSLSDDSGGNVPIDTLLSGRVTIPSQVVPEPSSLPMLVAVLAAILTWRRRTK